mgnify:FL=1
MSTQTSFDLQAAHRHFSAACFNQAWDLMDKTVRTPEEDEQMLRLSLASHYHWTQREDCQPGNESIAYWQTSRIYVLLHQPDNAHRYAEKSLAASRAGGETPFLMGYSFEALARAAAAAGNQAMRDDCLAQARQFARKITDPEDQKALLADLETVLSKS